MLKKASGSTFLEINGKEIKNILINIPSLPEQEKIANFLSSIDRKIKSLKRGYYNRCLCKKYGGKYEFRVTNKRK